MVLVQTLSLGTRDSSVYSLYHIATLNVDHQRSSTPLAQGKWLPWRRQLSQGEEQGESAGLELCHSGSCSSPTV